MWPLSFSMVLQTLQLFNSLHFAMLCAMQSILEQSKRGLANPTVSQLFNSLYFTCLLLCRGLPSIPTEELQTLQLFNYLHFTMLCAMHSILEQSKRGRANPTISCSTLCSFRCFLRCKAFQSIAKEVLQTLQSVSCSILCILMCLLLCGGLPGIPTEELQTLQLFNSLHVCMPHSAQN